MPCPRARHDHFAAEGEAQRFVEGNRRRVAGLSVQKRPLTPVEDLRGYDRGQVSRIAPSTEVGMRAHRTHLDKAVQLHPFSRHRDQPALMAYAIERTELMRAGLDRKSVV